jgi:hypothetical protein
MAKHSKTSRRGRKQRRGYRRTQKRGMYWKTYIPPLIKR